jgi:hypothetical protein
LTSPSISETAATSSVVPVGTVRPSAWRLNTSASYRLLIGLGSTARSTATYVTASPAPASANSRVE